MPTCPAGHDTMADDYCDTCGLALTGARSGPAPASGPGQAPPVSSPGPGQEAGPEPTPGTGPTSEGSSPAAGPVSASGSGPVVSPPPAGGSQVSEAPPAGVTSCPACGELAGGRFCESCGYDLVSGRAPVPAPATVTLTLSADRGHWDRMVGSGEPVFPAAVPALTFQLTGDRATLGRIRTGARADVDLALTGAAADPAVSHHQCEFERGPDGLGWVVRDSGSANGTWINDADQPLAAGQIHPLADGDRIRIGAWTCLTVHVTTPPGA